MEKKDNITNNQRIAIGIMFVLMFIMIIALLIEGLLKD